MYRKVIFAVLVAVISSGLGSLVSKAATTTAQEDSSTNSPVAVIRDLYKVHGNGESPLFKGEDRKHVDKYFDKKLADMIWKNTGESSSGEVGNLDFDPLYNAQDFQITDFQIGGPKIEQDKAVVVVTFNNFNQKTKITFHLRNISKAWKIENLVYEDGSDLIKILSAPQ